LPWALISVIISLKVAPSQETTITSRHFWSIRWECIWVFMYCWYLACIWMIHGSAWFPLTIMRTPSTVPSMESSSLTSSLAASRESLMASDLPLRP
jgi:hypothetical protein